MGGIDPRLLKHFALFREAGPGPDGPLDEDEAEAVAFREQIAAGSSHMSGGAGSTAGIEGPMDGRPVCSSGPTFFGLAPDGVQLQRVEFRDSSAGQAAVRHNTYMIDDPSWRPD